MNIGDLVTWVKKPQGKLYLDNEIGIVIGSYNDVMLDLVKIRWLNGRYSDNSDMIMDKNCLRVIEVTK